MTITHIVKFVCLLQYASCMHIFDQSICFNFKVYNNKLWLYTNGFLYRLQRVFYKFKII